MKKCPYCAEEIQDAAIKCKHCGSDLLQKPPALPSQPPLAVQAETHKLITNYKIILRKLETHKAYLEFCDKLKSALNISSEELKNYLTPGNPIQSFQDKASATKFMKALSSPGIKLELVEEQVKQEVSFSQKTKVPAGSKWDTSMDIPDDWYERTFYILVLCFVFAPAGLILLWRAKLYSQQTRVLLTGTFTIWFMIVAGYASSNRSPTTQNPPATKVSNNRSSTTQRPPANTVSEKMWFQGGNLHNATVGQWKEATYQNKLATASDWLAGTIWKGHLNSLSDFDKIKVKAEMLVNAIDVAVSDNDEIDHLKVNEMAAALVTLSNDFGP